MKEFNGVNCILLHDNKVATSNPEGPLYDRFVEMYDDLLATQIPQAFQHMNFKQMRTVKELRLGKILNSIGSKHHSYL